MFNLIPKTSKKKQKKQKKVESDSSNLVSPDHQLLKNNRTLTFNKMKCKEISIIMSSNFNIPTSQICFKKRFPLCNLQWKDTLTFLLKFTINAYLRSFQYKYQIMYFWFIKHRTMFFLQNERGDNKSPILLLH